MREPTSALWLSDAPSSPTGFGRVTNEILSRLASHHQLKVSATGISDKDASGSRRPFDLLSLPAMPAGRDDIERAVEALSPSVVVTLGDPWAFGYMVEVVRRWPVKWVGYFPIDAGPLPSYLAPVFAAMDRRVTTSQFSAEVFREAYPELEISVIRHGVDTAVFLPGLPAARPMLPDGREPFIVGCVARNHQRKGLATLIEAFALFARFHDDVLLHLHTCPWDSAGWVLEELLRRHGVLERTIIVYPIIRTGV